MREFVDSGRYGTSKAEALRAHHDGYPALLPNGNRWKSLVEAHRYGQHRSDGPAAPGPATGCPACEEGDK